MGLVWHWPHRLNHWEPGRIESREPGAYPLGQMVQVAVVPGSRWGEGRG
jgi:hypothetical protein